MTSSTPYPGADAELTQSRSREARLRERVDELEAELENRDRNRPSSARRSVDESVDKASDVSSRGVDQLSRLVRGVALASVEVVRATTDAVDTAAQRVYDKNRREDDDDTPRRLAARLPGSLLEAMLDGVDSILDVPERAIDKLRDTYHEDKAPRSERPRRVHAEADAEREDERIRQALGRPATRVILDAQDQVILDAGATITNQSIREARAAGVLDILLDSVST